MITSPLAFEKLFQMLKETGLSAKEANTYITLLSINANPASIIAKKAGLNRCSCYTLLERLIHKGFIQKIIRGKTTYYGAVELRYVLDNLKNKNNELESKIENLNQALNAFELIKKENDGKPKVTFYEGETAIQNILEDRLTANNLIRSYASLNELEDMFPRYLPHFRKRRVEKGIYVKAIYPANPHSYGQKLKDPQELRQSRLIPREFDFHLLITIYGNKVAITSLREKFGVLIESKEMAEAQSKIFDFIWAGSKKYDEIMTRMIQQELEKAPSSEERLRGL